MKDLINSSKKILIVLPQNVNLDSAAAGLALAQIIDSQTNEITFAHEGSLPKEITKIIDLSKYKMIHTIKQSEVVLSLNRKKGDVKAVRWREIDDQIQFIITPENDDFEFKDVDLSSIGGDFNLIIMIGCINPKHAGKIYTENIDFFEKNDILNIDINKSNTNFGKTNKIGEDSSLSSWIFDLSKNEGFELNKESVASLFKGIFWSNEGFRKNDNLKKALKKLTATNGELSEVITPMFDSLSIAELRYLGKIISNMNIDSEGIIISQIPNSDIQGVNLDHIIYPEINIISRVRDYKVAIILSEHEPNNISVRIYSNDQSINIFQKFIDFTPVGNARRITFSLEGQLEETRNKLVSILSQETKEVTTEVKKDTHKVPTSKEEKKEPVEEKSKDSKGEQKAEPLQAASTLPQAVESDSDYQTPTYPTNQPVQQQSFNPTPPIYPNQPLPPAQPY